MTDTALDRLPQLSRSLLTPGPLAPFSHFGLTLFRHVVATSLRYSLYHLGLPVPDAPPVRLLSLRLFLDSMPLVELLEDVRGGECVLAALLQPGSDGAGPPPTALRAAMRLHAVRLRLGIRKPRRGPAVKREGSKRRQAWSRFQRELRRAQPRLGDAMLTEILAVLDRQRRRSSGRRLLPSLGREAWRARVGGRADLDALGPLDPLLDSWSGDAHHFGRLLLRQQPVPAAPGRRGTFREVYRSFLSAVRPELDDFSRDAKKAGTVERRSDVYFIPFQLGDELLDDRRPAWLDAAVGTNRDEHSGLLSAPEHPDELYESPALAEQVDRAADWDLAPTGPIA